MEIDIYSPEGKARQLINKFNWNKLFPLSTRVYCAIIVCDEVLEQYEEDDERFEHWNEVKDQIKKMLYI
ncbi:MAG: hypothetical protein AABY22_36270 [Nanoarchaeota archaeon]